MLLASVGLFLYRASETPPGPASVCPDCAYAKYVTRQDPKQLAITFDDGPIAEHTPQILDTLEAHGARATFFVLGQNALREPDIVRDISERGHGVGNHTFSHEKSVHATEERLIWELNSTNRVIESITGRSAILYRPPYLLDFDDKEVRPVFSEEAVWGWASAQGYVPVGADLDAHDWREESAEDIVANVTALLDEKDKNPQAAGRHVVLLHDSAATAEALDEVLTLIESRGYEVVPLESLLGMTERESMPYAGTHEDATENIMALLAFIWPGIALCVVFMGAAVLLRPAALLLMSTFAKPQEPAHKIRVAKGDVRVSVLVPAWNEAENIQATLRSILGNTRSPEEIIVINDGSTDQTEALARAVALSRPKLIKVLSQENKGKAAALNAGIAAATGDILVMIDGDTVLDEGAIQKLVALFEDQEVGAVAGKIVPAAARTLVERFQEIEYVSGQNIDKVAFGRFGAVGIVPGALGAWRRDAVEKAGGYSEDTLVEDQDLTFAVLALGYKVAYAPDAIAYTEVPSTMQSFFFQRYRWLFGTLQCAFKYRTLLFSRRAPRLGFGVLPYSVLFNAILPILAFVVQGMILIGVAARLLHPAMLFLILLTFLDIGYVWIAKRREAHMSPSLALVPIQRFFYLVAYTGLTFLTTVKALDGTPTRWHKIRRTGSASLFASERIEAEAPIFPVGLQAH
jgi:cellulose synthase/poly-beta-1,6-N-acetylglucosamine synthase-like glycosyltransferase/peptidoglycan/xylan/chitin deacetylase (PgdA/CDA1 family)